MRAEERFFKSLVDETCLKPKNFLTYEPLAKFISIAGHFRQRQGNMES